MVDLANLGMFFAQVDPLDGGLGEAPGLGAMIAAMVVPLIFIGLILIVVIAGMWKTFEKASKPGWAAIVPIYNMIVLLEIVGKPIWWIALILFVPCVNIIILIIVFLELAKCFGKGAGFGLGLAFFGFIFFPLLGFGDAQYQAPPPPA